MRPAAAAPSARRLVPALALGLACAAQAAPNDPLAWLQRAAQAARETTFAGTYVHTNGERTATLRITHVASGDETHERIEPLDASTHEIVRRNDEMYCRFPDAKTVRLDPRITARFFPALLGSSVERIAANYDVKLGQTERVLGFECRWLRLEPRDAMRFAQRVCSEIGSGLVLRAKTLDGDGRVIEQYTFTDLRMGPAVARTDVRSIFKARTRQWLDDGQPRDEAIAAETGWEVSDPPAGFRKVAELKRTLPGRSEPVSQIVLSDGLASLSVFVEPNAGPGRNAETFSEDGTTTFFVRPMGEVLVSVLGEVPLATAQQVGRAVTRRP
ncbi:MAG TPA: MucB/RseB C-terminal domain-containing protein [Myxococcota bacterium]|nr:MucB/RseB C-terminal domain-containing protein [Myxococcota bacterium]